ncbi:MAG TPA: type II toxin-antitoxin system VapC family toxin [Candidatus Sulfotelmatobacter sp.]|nr:type II toxin-antitoxin system VapC family toxin [Candidatus Sulfotelmatobacter sp.]
MKILIDTHVLLWGLQDEAKLSRRVRTLLPSADVWISVASLWEIIAKVQSGKLVLPTPVGDYLRAKLTANGVSVLPVTFDHVTRLEGLQLHHRDPFDRILIAQSLSESLPLVTADVQFDKYALEVIW